VHVIAREGFICSINSIEIRNLQFSFLPRVLGEIFHPMQTAMLIEKELSIKTFQEFL
jgi:hypothetical protein